MIFYSIMAVFSAFIFLGYFTYPRSNSTWQETLLSIGMGLIWPLSLGMILGAALNETEKHVQNKDAGH